MTSEESKSNPKFQDGSTTQMHSAGPVDVTYLFVWSEVSHEKPRRYDDTGSRIRIRSVNQKPSEDGILSCSARFAWRSFRAKYTCLYHPSTDTFSKFELQEETMKGGMEEIDEAVISFDIDHDKEDGPSVRSEVRDDNGNRFMVVYLDFGYSGCVEQCGHVYGKKALTKEEKWDGMELSREERARLGISDERWEEAEDTGNEEDVDK